MFTAFALMTFAMLATAFVVIAMLATAAFVVIIVMVRTLGIAIIAITVATTTTRASAHLLHHAVSNLFIRGSLTLFNCQAKILINGRKKSIKFLTSLQEATASIVFNNILTQSVKLGNFFFGRRHAGHVFIAKLLTILIYFAEQIRSLGILVKEANTSIGRNNFLTLSKSRSKLCGQLNKLGGKRCIRHNTQRLA